MKLILLDLYTCWEMMHKASCRITEHYQVVGDDVILLLQVRSYGLTTSSEHLTSTQPELQSSCRSPHHEVHHPQPCHPQPCHPQPACHPQPCHPQPHADFTRFTSELIDKDKSLTTRGRSNNRLLSPHPQSSPSPLLFDHPDPRLLDSYILSRLHFEEFLRSQSDLFYQMMRDREQALSVKSDSVAGTPRGSERDRAGSSQSDAHYSLPWKTKCDKLCGIPAGNGLDYEVNGIGSGPSFSDNLSNSSSTSTSNKYFDKCVIRTNSLNELETLVDQCIMPESEEEALSGPDRRLSSPPPAFIRVQRSPCYPVVPRGTRTVSPEAMLLGGVLSLPHATRYVEESRNGCNGVASEECLQNGGAKAGKTSMLPWKRSSKTSKNKAKSEKQALAS